MNNERNILTRSLGHGLSENSRRLRISINVVGLLVMQIWCCSVKMFMFKYLIRFFSLGCLLSSNVEKFDLGTKFFPISCKNIAHYSPLNMHGVLFSVSCEQKGQKRETMGRKQQNRKEKTSVVWIPVIACLSVANSSALILDTQS